MLTQLRKIRPDLYEKISDVLLDMTATGGKWDDSAAAVAELADFAEELILATDFTAKDCVCFDLARKSHARKAS